MPHMLRDIDGGTDSDGEGYEAVTPEHNVKNSEGENTPVPAVDKRIHILEDVDGELEMEDVVPCCEGEIASTSNITGADQTKQNHQSDNHYGAPFTPQEPKDGALTSASLSSSTLPCKPKPYSSRQEYKRNYHANSSNQSIVARVKPTAADAVRHYVRENKDFESQRHRQMTDSNSVCSYGDRPTSHVSSRASYSNRQTDSLNKGFHLRPPHPAPSNRFSYIHGQRIEARRNTPPSSHSNRYHIRDADNGNFYKVRGRNKFVPHDNNGECWRPPFSSYSGPCFPDNRSPMPYSSPPREPPFPNNRWNFPPRPMNHRHFNYRSSSEGPVPVANRGPFWRPR